MKPIFTGTEFDQDRRRLLDRARLSGLALVAGSLAPRLVTVARAEEGKKKEAGEKEAEVTPPEDLMREHGVLDRVLLIYEAGMKKFATNETFDPTILSRSAEVVRDFIENYHEKSEEDQVFPRFRKAGKMVDLVDTLLAQHRAGRRVTASILDLVPKARQDGDDRRKLVTAMQSFIAMYRPHAAREDTDLFPKLSGLVSKHEYDAMAEDFEKKEHELFGEDGFEKMAEHVAELERAIGIDDLRQFTPA